MKMNLAKVGLFVAVVLVAFVLSNCSKTEVIPGVQGETVTDFEGNIYHTVLIGSQTWMAENLRSIKLSDGTQIPYVTNNNTWSNLVTPGYSYYSNDSVNFKYGYGALYNWYCVKSGKLCPTGWHVPTDADWTTLINGLGVDSMAGGKLKLANYSAWISPNLYATNSTGFNAVPSGYRFYNGSYNNTSYSGNFWSATENNTATAWYRYLTYDKGKMYRNSIDKQYGFSIRCLKN